MKKLFIAASAALLACTVQAFTVSWNAKTTTNGDATGNWLGVALAAGYDASKTSSWSLTFNQSNKTASFTPPAGVTVYETTVDDKYARGVSASGNFVLADTSTLTAGTQLSLLFYSPGWFGNNKYFQAYTFELTQAMLDADGVIVTVDSVRFGNPGSNKTLTGAVALPEPTVLALLAVGVAGLALRRRA